MFIDTEVANKGTGPKFAVDSNPAIYSEQRTPLMGTFVGQDAPPSYLEATTPVGWRGEGVGLLNEERVPFTPMREEEHQDGKYRRRSIKEHITRRRMLIGTAAILAIILFSAVVAAFNHKKEIPAPAKPVLPVLESPAKSKPTQGKQSFPIRWPANCGKAYNTKSEEMTFGKTADLNIVEAVHQLDGPYKRVSGWIHVAQGSASQAAGTIEAKLSYAVSPSVDVDSIKFAHTPTGLTIGDPSSPDGFDGATKSSACLGISIALYMAPGATLENFNIKSTHLGMQIHDGAAFSVTNATSISLTSGTLDAIALDSRETRLETTSGSISGRYSLFDLLWIKSISGSVNINVLPKQKSPDGPQIALLYADTMSGSIRVDTERKNIPERDYIVSMNTTVGSIDGTYIHGSRTGITSAAGSINVDLMPYSVGDSSILTTHTTDGQTILKLRAPYAKSGTANAMGKLTSMHTSVSGQLDLTYPQSWEGHVEGQSVTGTVHLQGRDLELLGEDNKPGFSRVEAEKGNGESTIVFKTTTGQCEVLVGEK